MEGTNLIQKRDFRKLLLDPAKIQANAQELIDKQRKKRRELEIEEKLGLKGLL